MILLCCLFLLSEAQSVFASPSANADAETEPLWHITGSSEVRLAGLHNIQRGSVLVDENSVLSILSTFLNPARLHIDGNLTVGDERSAGTVKVFGTLTVGKALDLRNGEVNNSGVLAIHGHLSSGVDGSLTLAARSLTTFAAADVLHKDGTINKDNFAGAFILENANASLLLTGWHSNTISQQEYQQLLDSLGSITYADIPKSNNFALWGVSVIQDDGTARITTGSGVGHVLAGDRITMSHASKNQLWYSSAYVAPQIVLDEYSDTLNVGTLYDINASLITVGLPTGTVNLVQNADGSVGNLRVAKGSSYTAGSGMASSGLLGHVYMAGTGIVNQGMSVGMESLNLDKGSLSVLGAEGMFTHVHTKMLGGDQGRLFLSPAVMSVDALENAVLRSKVLLSEGSALGIGVGHGSGAGLWAQQQQQAVQARSGSPVTGVLALGQSFTLESGALGGQIIVDKDVDEFGNLPGYASGIKPSVYFGESSLLIIDASSADIQRTVAKGEGIIRIHNTDKNVHIADSSRLLIHGAKGNQNYIIISGAENSPNGAGQGWSGAQVSTNTDMLRGDSIVTEDSLHTHFSVNKATEIYKGLSVEMANTVERMYEFGANDLHSAHAGLRFLSRVTDNTNTYLTKGQEARVLEGAARLSTVAGVRSTALAAADAGITALLYRTSTSTALKSWQLRSAFYPQEEADSSTDDAHTDDTDDTDVADVADDTDDTDDAPPPPSPARASQEPFTDTLPKARLTGISLWAMPLYQSIDTHSAVAGFASGINSTMQGLVLGIEHDTGDNYRYGLSVNMGKGNSLSHGDFFKTTNNYSFYGANAYAVFSFGNATLIGDVGLSRTNNTVRQQLPLLMDSPNLSATINTLVLNAGGRAEYTFRSPVLHITPHAGARFSLLHTGPFDSIHDDNTLFSTAGNTQTIWAIPAGFTLNKAWHLPGDWSIQPYFSSGVTIAGGGGGQSAPVYMPGLGTVGRIKSDVVNPLSYSMSAGVQSQKQGLDFGLQYSVTSGKYTTSRELFGTLTYTF